MCIRRLFTIHFSQLNILIGPAGALPCIGICYCNVRARRAVFTQDRRAIIRPPRLEL